MNKITLFITAFVLLLAACNTSEEVTNKKSSDPKSWSLEIIDSVQIDYLGNLLLVDISAKWNRIILYDNTRNSLVASDLKGNIIAEFSKTPDEPGGWNATGPMGASYISANEIAVQDRARVNILDESGEYLRSIENPFQWLPGIQFVGFRGIQYGSAGDSSYLVMHAPGRARFQFFQANYYEHRNALERINLTSEEYLPIAKFEENSLFKNGKSHDIGMDFPFFSISGNIIYFIYRVDNEVLAYSLETGELLKRWKTEPENYFKLPEGYPTDVMPEITDFQERVKWVGIAGINIGLVSFDNIVINTYKEGVSPINQDDYKLLEGDEASSFRDTFYQLFVDGKKIGELPANIKINRLFSAHSNDQIYATQDITFLGYEPDQVTIYRLQLHLENE
jgi:hypothetical protein